MRVICCGSRRWHDRQRIADRLFELPPTTVVVHGNAHGADRIAAQEAEKLGLRVEAHLPLYRVYSHKTAPLKRNEKLAELGADLCIAFWDGRSTGTAHMIAQAHAHGIPVEIVER